MKRVFALLLALILAYVMPFSALAESNPNVSSEVDNSIQIITSDAFNSLFCTDNTARTTSTTPKIDSVIYNYTLTPLSDDSDQAFATLSFTMSINSQSYTVNTSGSVIAYPLSSGDKLWEGPLCGDISISGIPYNILVGFSKLESHPDVQATVTIQALHEANAIDPIAFTFGGDVLTIDIYEEITNRAQNLTVNCSSDAYSTTALSPRSTGSYKNVGGDFSEFNSKISFTGYGQHATAYFNSTNHLAIAVESYCQSIDNYYSRSGTTETSVSYFKTKITRNSSNDNSYIAAINFFDFNVSGTDSGSGSGLVAALFEDIMGQLGVSTSLASALLDKLNGKVTYERFGNLAYVSVEFGLSQNANFDDTGVGVPIVFLLQPTTSTVTGSSSYTFNTSMMYRTTYLPNGSTVVNTIFTRTYDTSRNINVTLN